MAAHAENTLGGPSISQVFDLPLTVPTTKTCGTEGLFSSKDGEVLDLVAARGTGICTIVADQGAVAE